MDTLVVILILGAVVVLNVVAVSGLISAARLPRHAWKAARRSKGGTIFGIVVTGGIGGI